MNFKAIALLVAYLITAAGCSREEGAVVEKSVPVSGIATYQGKPLDFYQIVLEPAGEHRAAGGLTDAEGRFILGTNGADDGAVPGKHKVSVTYSGPPSEQEPGKEEFVKPPVAKVKVPPKFNNAATSGIEVDIPEGGVSDLKIELN